MPVPSALLPSLAQALAGPKAPRRSVCLPLSLASFSPSESLSVLGPGGSSCRHRPQSPRFSGLRSGLSCPATGRPRSRRLTLTLRAAAEGSAGGLPVARSKGLGTVTAAEMGDLPAGFVRQEIPGLACHCQCHWQPEHGHWQRAPWRRPGRSRSTEPRGRAQRHSPALLQ